MSADGHDQDKTHAGEISLSPPTQLDQLFEQGPLKTLTAEQKAALEQNLTRIQISASRS